MRRFLQISLLTFLLVSYVQGNAIGEELKRRLRNRRYPDETDIARFRQRHHRYWPYNPPVYFSYDDQSDYSGYPTDYSYSSIHTGASDSYDHDYNFGYDYSSDYNVDSSFYSNHYSIYPSSPADVTLWSSPTYAARPTYSSTPAQTYYHDVGNCDYPIYATLGRRTGQVGVEAGCGLQASSKRDLSIRELSDHLRRRSGVEIPTRIIGGTVSVPGQWPWLVGLTVRSTWDGSYRPYCGGTLISDQWVLTAAHCIRSRFCFHNMIFGEHDLDSNVEQTKEINLEKTFIHKDFNPATYENDVALVKLDRKLNLRRSKYITEACLPSADYNREGKRCYIAGWGTTRDGQQVLSRVVKHARVPIISDSTCQRTYGHRFYPGMFCAGNMAGGKDSCQGDSGGPLMCKNRNGVYTVVGVVSWGDGCGRAGKPGLYADVQYYMPWIQRVIADNP